MIGCASILRWDNQTTVLLVICQLPQWPRLRGENTCAVKGNSKGLNEFIGCDGFGFIVCLSKPHSHAGEL